jgi:hypothetical protein
LFAVRPGPSVTLHDFDPTRRTTGLAATTVQNIDSGIFQGKHEASAWFRLERRESFGLD